MRYEIFEVPGPQSEALFWELHRQFPQSGRYPFFIGDQEDRSRLEEQLEDWPQSPEEILAAAAEIDPLDLLAEWGRNMQGDDEDEEDEEWAEYLEEVEDDGDIEEFELYEEVAMEPAPLPTARRLSAPRNILTGQYLPTVYYGLADVQYSWQLPAVVKSGGWNACPHPHHHCVLWKYWYEQYGADLVSITGDVMEGIVRRPPATEEAALQLAWQQYWYCDDIVSQGTNTVAGLARTLLHSEGWYFWWD